MTSKTKARPTPSLKSLSGDNVFPVTIEVAIPLKNKSWSVLTMVNVKQSEFNKYQKRKKKQ